MNLQPGAHLPGGPIRRWQLVFIFLPFLLPLLSPQRVFIFANAFSLHIGTGLLTSIGLALLGFLVVVCVAGLVRQFPVWALPALGMGLFFVSALLQLTTQGAVYFAVLLPLYGGWPNFLVQKILIMLLVQLVYLVIMAALVAGMLRIFPGFHKRVRQEWTLLSFLLYGIAILPVLGNDEFHGIEGYQTAGLLVLALGAGLYLLAPKRWQRLLALVGPAVLSPVVMSLGLYQTFPAQAWADPANASFRIWEAIQPVLYLLPLPILLLLAALAPRLPWRWGSEPATSPAS